MKKNVYILLISMFLLSYTGCYADTVDVFSSYFAENKQELVEVVNPDYTYTYKTPDGRIIFNNLEQPLKFDSDLAIYQKRGKYGLVNKNGDFVVEPIYDVISDLHDGMRAFLFQDASGIVKIGYFNQKGEIAIEPIPADIHLQSDYSYDYNFYNGLAMYRDPNTNKYGYINKSGNLVIPIVYQWAEPFKETLAPVTMGDKYGYIDTTGQLVLPYQYVFANAFSEGLAAVYDGNAWGYIDHSGKYVIEPQFGSYEGHDGEDTANPFIDGYAAVYLGQGMAVSYETNDGKFALIDKEGNILNGLEYDSLWLSYDEFGKPYYSAQLDNKSYKLDSKGKILEVEDLVEEENQNFY